MWIGRVFEKVFNHRRHLSKPVTTANFFLDNNENIYLLTNSLVNVTTGLFRTQMLSDLGQTTHKPNPYLASTNSTRDQ